MKIVSRWPLSSAFTPLHEWSHLSFQSLSWQHAQPWQRAVSQWKHHNRLVGAYLYSKTVIEQRSEEEQWSLKNTWRDNSRFFLVMLPYVLKLSEVQQTGFLDWGVVRSVKTTWCLGKTTWWLANGWFYTVNWCKFQFQGPFQNRHLSAVQKYWCLTPF